MAVQAGLQGPDIKEWHTSGARGFWFFFAFVAILAIQFVVSSFLPSPFAEHHDRELSLFFLLGSSCFTRCRPRQRRSTSWRARG